MSFVSIDAYAVVSIDWTVSGIVVTDSSISEGNLASGGLVSLTVDATDNVTFTSNGILDTIDVTITSKLDSTGTILTLEETGINTGIFRGDGLDDNFVFLTSSNNQFTSTDSVQIQVDGDPASPKCNDAIISTLEGPTGDADGVFVFSSTEVSNGVPLGIAVLLTETSIDSCEFTGNFNFITSGVSNELTSTLLVSNGDIITILDLISGASTNAQIIPTVIGKGSIVADFDTPDIADAEVTATYDGSSSGLDLDDDGAIGRGGGGIVRPGLVVDSSSNSGGGGGCSDCIPPTLGVDSKNNRIVENGFSFNSNPVDVELFYTPYPLVKVNVGQENKVDLIIYDNSGTQNISHVGLGYGLGKGESFSESKATINIDFDLFGNQIISKFDPENVLDDIHSEVSKIKCNSFSKTQCLKISIYHTFREPLKFNKVATYVWDNHNNSWQNYYNHGIKIEGQSLNPLLTKQVAFGTKEMHGLYTLTQIDKFEDVWSDKFGNLYQHKGNNNFDKFQTTSTLTYDKLSSHGCDRNCNWFTSYKLEQEKIAEKKLIEISKEEKIYGFDLKEPKTFTSSFLKKTENSELQKRIFDEITKAENTVHLLYDKK